jgi:phage host-nuclease inhibitor protein Gam
MSDTQFLNWVAIKLKDVITAELKENSISLKEGWKRDNTTLESEYLSCNEDITVADIYVVYDWLKGHKIDMSLSIVKDIFSKPRSKELIKKIKDKQSELDFIQANKDNLIEDIDKQYTTQIANLEKQLAELKKKMKEDIDAVNNDCCMKIRNLKSELKELDR